MLTLSRALRFRVLSYFCALRTRMLSAPMLGVVAWLRAWRFYVLCVLTCSRTSHVCCAEMLYVLAKLVCFLLLFALYSNGWISRILISKYMYVFLHWTYFYSHFDRFFIKSCCKYSKVILTFSSFIFTLANYFLLVCLHFVLFINSQFTAFTSFVIDTIKCIDKLVLPIYISQHKVRNVAKLDHYLMLLC